MQACAQGHVETLNKRRPRAFRTGLLTFFRHLVEPLGPFL